MRVESIFSQKCSIIYCPWCGKVKKHGKWIELTVYESQKLSQRYSGFNLIEETCPHCKTNEIIGS